MQLSLSAELPTYIRQPSLRTLRGLDGLNFFLAKVQSGVGPFLAVYLASHHWTEQRIGIALTMGGVAGILTQTPAGWLVDRIGSNRALIGIGVTLLALGTVLTALFPSFWPIVMTQVLIGGISSVFVPAMCAMSLGIVGHEYFGHRQGRNQTFNSAGSVTAAILIGLIGYFFSNQGIFYFVCICAVPAILTLMMIRPDEIDYDLARGSRDRRDEERASSAWELLKDRTLVIFLVCAAMYHFANAAMLPLLGEILAKGSGRNSMMLMSACVITTQIVIGLFATWTGRRAGSWGRKPLLLIAFGVLPIRGLLYTLTKKTALLIAIQVLDGLGGGIFSVVSVLVIYDLTRRTGRFSLALGAIATAVGIGASLSQSIAGTIVHHFSFQAGFLFLSGVALFGLAFLYFFMPETREPRLVPVE